MYVWRTKNEHAKSRLFNFNRTKNSSYEVFHRECGVASTQNLHLPPSALLLSETRELSLSFRLSRLVSTCVCLAMHVLLHPLG